MNWYKIELTKEELGIGENKEIVKIIFDKINSNSGRIFKDVTIFEAKGDNSYSIYYTGSCKNPCHK